MQKFPKDSMNSYLLEEAKVAGMIPLGESQLLSGCELENGSRIAFDRVVCDMPNCGRRDVPGIEINAAGPASFPYEYPDPESIEVCFECIQRGIETVEDETS